MSARAHVVVLFALVALGACKKAAPPSAPPKALPVAIFLDDRQVATEALLSTTPRPLMELAPGAPAPEAWLAVIALDAGGKATTIMAPEREHAGTPPALAAGPDGVRFGLARAGALDGPVERVAKVIIKTKDDRGAIAAELAGDSGHHGGGDSDGNRHDGEGERPTATAELVIAISTPKGEATFTGDKLAALPTIKAPTGDTETPGWNLVDILGAAGIKDPKVVVLTDEEKASLRIEGDDWDPAKTVLYVKLNKSG